MFNKRRTTHYILWGSGLLGLSAVIFVSLWIFSSCGTATIVNNCSESQDMQQKSFEILRVMTLNIAHGRGDGMNQLFRQTATLENNLAAIGELLKSYKVDVAALQEADVYAWWSGGRNQVELITKQSNFPYYVHGGLKGFVYGAALISTLPLMYCQSHAFRACPPTFTKGFVTAEIRSSKGQVVIVVSVHLDYSRKYIRKRQIDEMIEALETIEHPLIVMGDFNCNWIGKEDTLRRLAERLKLKTFEPDVEDETTWTYPSGKKRLDWIFISEELEFGRFQVLDEIVSDHKGLLAEIRIL